MSVNILITGGSRGIGKGIAAELAKYYTETKQAVNIIICSRNEAQLGQVKRELTTNIVSIHTYICDLSSAADITAMVDSIHNDIGNIDILINNAGISQIGLLQDMSAADISLMMNTNLNSAVILSSLLISDLLKSENNPRIINISSVWGNVGASCEVSYSAAKGGLNAFTRALARELAPSHIPVNAIACGYIETEMNNHLSDSEKSELFMEIPAGRPGSTKEIGQTVCLLLKATDYLTGQIITVDGGWT